jgi:endonuclease/exonuclease/phosphatase family metal-dependent hydrolase
MRLRRERAMDQVTAGSFLPLLRLQLWRRDSFRVVSWNIERGQRLSEVVAFLEASNADLILLQEVDLHAHRTHRRDIAAEIAQALHMNFVFGKEFEELSQGTQQSPAYQGQATISPWPIKNARLIRFEKQTTFWRPHWYLPRIEPFQERLGGRIALVADVQLQGEVVTTCNLHLESREDDALRLEQLRETLVAVSARNHGYPTVLAGDLNFDVSEGPASAALQAAGFRDAIGLRKVSTRPRRGLFDPGRSIDWMFISEGVKSSKGKIHTDVRASDHFPLSFTLDL